MTDKSNTTTTPSKSQPAATMPRSLSLFGAIVIGVALVGFLQGIAENDTTAAPTVPLRNRVISDADNISAAASYSTMHSAEFSQNAHWSGHLRDLKYDHPSRQTPVKRTTEMKLAAIADRARNRAFDGAPPVIPHRIEQQSAASCLACHGEGMKLGDRIAVKVSHAHYSSCTQCHVESAASGPFAPVQTEENSFAGLYRSGPGDRAFPNAPPTIPHTTWLREDCMSCHGTIARPGLRTTHPWFSACTQCHAPSSELDQSGLRATRETK